MRIKKTVWTFFMLIMAATLVLIINSRVQLTSEVVVGGADSVFVKTNALTDPMAEYENSSKASLEKYADLEFPAITITEWKYVLINKDTPIKSYAPSVRQFGSDGPYVDKRMMTACPRLSMRLRKQDLSRISASDTGHMPISSSSSTKRHRS